mmetsp:Transcript_63590/g.148990  ORF Transcript_63590/g.148990 Transcript_63590/m.148990 type:complete len:222 (-) Transcript_63590:1448-2113(-)
MRDFQGSRQIVSCRCSRIGKDIVFLPPSVGLHNVVAIDCSVYSFLFAIHDGGNDLSWLSTAQESKSDFAVPTPGVNDLVAHPPNHLLLGANVHASGSVSHLRCKQDFGVLLFDIGRLWVCLRLPFNDCLLVAAHPQQQKLGIRRAPLPLDSDGIDPQRNETSRLIIGSRPKFPSTAIDFSQNLETSQRAVVVHPLQECWAIVNQECWSRQTRPHTGWHKSL